MQPVAPGSPFEIRTVAIIGAGTAGRSFALACAAVGYRVVLEDVMPANLRRAEADFAEMDLRDSSGTLGLALTVEDAVREADIAIDFVPDELESKLEIFSMIDRMAPPKTILCTPSNALSITDLASCVYRPERCFAVRGDRLAASSAVRLLYSPSADERLLVATVDFLRSLRIEVQSEPDPDMPILLKNLAHSAL
ncbi:3-hydroxyacyl-CoA dehydrogenase NAD-binding domain-containing protein [Edaphobacter paludis]|uniref:3-hydroxyacyl-CoA dehydrogenase NAD-binding domain-containing protein n=1 Tax=Edaphobacter paludis TaxID=3035702 RepID=A0AAU7DBB2_9BACT